MDENRKRAIELIEKWMKEEELREEKESGEGNENRRKQHDAKDNE